jgi:diaminopimelate decarboxylase
MEPALRNDPAGRRLVTTVAHGTPTPFYLYDRSVFTARVALLRSALPAGARLLYSAKANPRPELLAAAAAAGCGLELASDGELAALRAAGAEPADAVLVGPAKTDALLAEAVHAGVGTVVVESERELRRLDTVASAARGAAAAPLDVLLRLSLPGARGSLRMSGHQFGMDRDEVRACHKLLRESTALSFAGYHGYLASQLLRADDVLHNAALVTGAVAELGAWPRHIDYGGGFGIALLRADQPLDLDRLAAGLATEPALPTGPDAPVPLFESGRFLAGPAGALVCRVVDAKAIDGRRFVLLDGGMNTSGLFGGANAQRGLPFTVLRDGAVLDGGERSSICGPLCTPMDLLAAGVPCAAEPGDLVVWWQMGAYGLTAAPVGFLSFPAPAEVVI